jgi:HKD family nuclease
MERSEDHIKIISPFIGRSTSQSLAAVLETNLNLKCTLITRFYREDFINRASSLEGLDLLLRAGAQTYALQDLHTKLYIFDSQSVITGSSNFTFNGFYKNHEFGFLMENESVFAEECMHYFNGLLKRIQQSGDWELTQEKINQEKMIINDLYPNREGKKNEAPLKVFNTVKWGAELKHEKQQSPPAVDENADFVEAILKSGEDVVQLHTGIWLKFEGNGDVRVSNDLVYMDRKRNEYEQMNRTFFPTRPTGIKKGDLVFMAVVSNDDKGRETPMIIGYSTTNGFQENNAIGHNDRFYRETDGRYPYYIELQDATYLKTSIKYGVSLLDLCRDVGFDLYPRKKSSMKNLLSTHHQKSHLQITPIARDYLIRKLDELFAKYGSDQS